MYMYQYMYGHGCLLKYAQALAVAWVPPLGTPWNLPTILQLRD